MRNKILLMGLSIVLAAGLLGGATLAWFSDSAEADAIDMSAGTLMIEAGTAMIYGIDQETGDIYEVDVASGQEYLLYDRDTPYGSPGGNWLNGLALDRQNARLYYAYPNNDIWFYDIHTGVDAKAGSLTGSGGKVSGATFGQGYYWYVPDGTDDLWKVKFDADGKNPNGELVALDFASDEAGFGFGDLALNMNEGIIYGSVYPSGAFFEIDTRNEYEYKEYSTSGQKLVLQLAFGANGKLYGHRTTEKDWYEVNFTGNNAVSFVRLDWTGEHHFTDLASNFQNNWNPGDEDPVRYYVTNVGSKTSYVRAIIESYGWVEGLDGNNVSFTSATPDWKEGKEGYFYYQHILNPNETATPLFIIVHLNGEGTDNDYQGKEYTMQVKFEAFQTTNGAGEASDWDLSTLP